MLHVSTEHQFTDHFSAVAAGYSEYRPRYPDQLFDALQQQVTDRTLVWDCGAGTGQATVALAERFESVLGTDASVQQVAQASRHERAHYAVALAESCPLPSASVSLVTVAQALHWFDVQKFYREVKRVLTPGGLLCVWSYGLLRVDENKAVEKLIERFSEHTLGKWWPKERRHVDVGYTDLPFPFEHEAIGPLDMTAAWGREQLLGYLRTWSSVSRKREADGVDPVAAFAPALSEAWGANPTLALRWPLVLRAGR